MKHILNSSVCGVAASLAGFGPAANAQAAADATLKAGLGKLTAAVNCSYKDRAYASVPDKRQILPGYGLLDARLTLSDISVGPVNLRLSAWGRTSPTRNIWCSKGLSICRIALTRCLASGAVAISI